MIPADVKGDVKQQQAKADSYISNFLSEVPSSKLEIQWRTDMYFSFDFARYSI